MIKKNGILRTHYDLLPIEKKLVELLLINIREKKGLQDAYTLHVQIMTYPLCSNDKNISSLIIVQ